MKRSVPFRLNRSSLLLALVSAAFAGQAVAAAGRVDFALGGATVAGADGRERPVTRGAELNSGDVVRTNDGRVQVRMTDGAFISLQPNTEFGIKDYSFEGKTDGSENALYSLVKGAMRTVTGLIGRVNRNRYLVTTPTATVGIRGTGGLIQVLDDGSTLVQGTSGIWFLANPAGSIDIPAGVAGVAPVDPKQPPKETVQIPVAGPAPLPPLQEFSQGDERTADGRSVFEVPAVPLLPTTGVLASGAGHVAALAYGLTDGDAIIRAQVPPPPIGTAAFDGTGQMTAFSYLENAYSLGSGGSHAEFGTDGILAWGRWIGEVSFFSGSVTENYDLNQGLHYVVGVPTASMPQSGAAHYTMLGATSPTYVDGTVAPGTFSGTLNVNFLQMTVGMNLNVGIDGKGYAIGGTSQIAGNTFVGSVFSGVGNLTIGGTNGACSSSPCNALVNGFFAGTSAERAGLGYRIDDTAIQKSIVGAAAFTTQTAR